MKKILTIIAMGVLCMCVTSCSDICEEAYIKEQEYKLFREKVGQTLRYTRMSSSKSISR